MMVWPGFISGGNSLLALAKLAGLPNRFNVAVAILYAADSCVTSNYFSAFLLSYIGLHHLLVHLFHFYLDLYLLLFFSFVVFFFLFFFLFLLLFCFSLVYKSYHVYVINDVFAFPSLSCRPVRLHTLHLVGVSVQVVDLLPFLQLGSLTMPPKSKNHDAITFVPTDRTKLREGATVDHASGALPKLWPPTIASFDHRLRLADRLRRLSPQGVLRQVRRHDGL